jgi:hypothetical protein
MKNLRFNGRDLAAATVGGAIGGVVLWYALNGMIVVNGQGILMRAGRPLNSPIPFALVGANIVPAIVYAIKTSRVARSLRAELPEVARGLGLAYEEGEFDMILWEGPKDPPWQAWGRGRNFLSGRSDGVPAEMFDLTTTTISKSGERGIDEHWTAVLFQRTHLPVFACIPKSWSTLGDRRRLSWVSLDPEVGDQMTRQAVADFQKTYALGVPKTAVQSHEDEVRRLFRAPRLEALARCPGWYVQSSGKCLVFACSGTAPAADRPALWHEAIEIRRALLAPVSSAVMPIPVAPGMERDRQSVRQSGRSWGRLTGAVIGFFGSFIAFMAFMFSGGPAAGRFMFAGIPVLLGGLALGAFAGSRLGRRLADRSYRPTPDGAPAPTIGIGDAFGWVVAGAFAGFVLGGVSGMGLVTVLTRVIPFHWVMVLVFFSPPVLCLLLGGFAGYRVARRRADRRKEVLIQERQLAESKSPGAPARQELRGPKRRPHRDDGSSGIEAEVCGWLTEGAGAKDRDGPRDAHEPEGQAAGLRGQPSDADSLPDPKSDAHTPTDLPA